MNASDYSKEMAKGLGYLFTAGVIVGGMVTTIAALIVKSLL